MPVRLGGAQFTVIPLMTAEVLRHDRADSR